MHGTHSIHYKRRGSWWLWVVGLVGLCVLLLAPASKVFAASMPGGDVTDPAIRGANIASPSIVRVITSMQARLTVQLPPTTQVAFPQEADGKYLLQFSGTGAFISSHGDILTADHVINPARDKELDMALYTTAAADIAAYLNNEGQQVTEAEVIEQLSKGELESTPTYDDPTHTVFLSTNYTGPLDAPNFNSLPDGVALEVDQIKEQSSFDENDLAIIHVPMEDTPGIAVGDSASVQLQDTLTVIGFPGNADVTTQPGDLLTPSRNTVTVSALKGGSTAPLLQVSGNLGHGDSGAPALNEAGEIVGIVSFGQSDPDAADSRSIFLRASASAATMIEDANLDTTPGDFQQLWNQAFLDYADTTPGHWSKAQTGFDQLAQEYPLFKAVEPYQSYASQQAAQETATTPTPDPTPTSTPTQTNTQPTATVPTDTETTSSVLTDWIPASLRNLPLPVLVGGGIAIVLLFLVLPFTVIARSRNRKKKKALPSAPVNTQNGATAVKEKDEQPQEAKVQPAVSPPTPAPAPATVAQPALKPPDIATSQQTLSLKIWPCGHMNRTTARFCSICGEATPD